MLAATLENPERLPYPVMVSPKLDGLRCLTTPNGVVSRNLKLFRNAFVQEVLSTLPAGLDGELIVGSATEGHVLGRTQSGIMSVDGEPDFTFHVFDQYLAPNRGFRTRHDELQRINHSRMCVVPHVHCANETELLNFESVCLATGYEGIMIRGINGHYKFGRATHRDELLWKFKRFMDGEAIITQVLEGVHNTNAPTQDALGNSKRSNHQAGKVESGRVGTIYGLDCKNGAIVCMSPGRMTQDMREHYWGNPNEIIGKIAHYKSFEYGRLNAGRFITFQGFRDPADMGPSTDM